MLTFSVRLRFNKVGLIRFISHLDYGRAVLRAMSRAEMPFVYSQGYSPRPKISFCPPLALGWESETELMEVELTGTNDWMNLSQKINENLPEELRLTEIVHVSKKGLLNKEIKYTAYCIGLPKGFDKELGEIVNLNFADKRIEILKDEKRSENDIIKDYFVLKIDETARMKDILSKLAEPLGEFNISVRRVAFYDKEGRKI